MSKQLPYFQFEPAEWLAGDVSMCSMEAQGLFVNIKCVYWQKEGDLSLSQIRRRFKNHLDLIDELIEDGIIKTKGDKVVIEFLDMQRTAILRKKKRNSENGYKGAVQRIKNQELRKQGSGEAEAPPKHLDKIREDNTDNNTPKPDKSGSGSGKKSEGINWEKLLLHFNETFGKKSRVVNDTVKKSFRARMKDYVKEDIVDVMNKIKKDKFHIENNFKHVTLEYIARPNTFDKYASMSDEDEQKVALKMNK